MAEQTQPTTAKEILDRVHSIKGSPDKEIAAEKNRATAAGGIAGGVFGLYYGYSRQKNPLVWGLVGAIAGAVVVRVVMPKNA